MLCRWFCFVTIVDNCVCEIGYVYFDVTRKVPIFDVDGHVVANELVCSRKPCTRLLKRTSTMLPKQYSC